MRILWVNHRDPKHPEAGGAEVHLNEVCKRLVERGCQVTLLSERFPGSTQAETLDGIDILRSGGRFDSHLYAPIQVSRLGKENDVVVDDIAHAIPWWSGLVTTRPVVGMVHHVHQSVATFELGRPFGVAARMAEKTIRFSYRRIITVSETSKQQIETELGVDPTRIRVVYHGVDHKRFGPSTEKFEEPTILSLGRIKRYKNLEDLLLAFALAQRQIPQLRLIIAGDGDHKSSLEETVRRLELNNVIFVGQVGMEDKVKLLQKSWGLCLTSSIEGWGLVLTEAAACGLPAIAYDSGATREAVIDGKTGFVVAKGNVQSLAERIVQLVSDAGVRRTLSMGAIEYSQNFDWDKTADQTLNVLSEAVNN